MAVVIEYLEWDSDFFGIKTGKIIHSKEQDIEALVENAKNDGFYLLYLFCDEDFYFDEIHLKKYNLRLVDRKIVYRRFLDKFDKMDIKNDPAIDVWEYKDDNINKEMKELGIMSGEYSRFRLDKNFDTGLFEKLYETWIQKSVRKEIADKVYITKGIEGKTNGMVTLKFKGKNSEIGLIAVRTEERGKGYGKALVKKCFSESVESKIMEIKVATQYENRRACKFYEGNGFKAESLTNIYHLWLK